MNVRRMAIVAGVILVVVGCFALANAQAAVVLFDRALPTDNINNAAGANRSNVTWQETDPGGFTGDDFTIGTVGQTYLIDSLTVWGAQYNPLSDDISNIALYVGKDGEALALASSGSVTGNVDSNPNISHTFVTYGDVSNTDFYEGNGGVHYSICQTTFSGLNIVVQGGVLYNFGVIGDGYLWWNHASNAALSGLGTPEDGADDLYKVFQVDTDPATATFVETVDSNGNGWDKSSDINVQVTGSQVPEPTTILVWGMLGVVAVGFGAWRRRRAG